MRISSRMNLSDWNKQWLGRVEGSIRDTSLAQYKDVVETVLAPAVDGIRLKDVDEQKAYEIVCGLYESGRGRSRAGLAVIVQKMSLDAAYEEGFVDYNAFSLIKLPRRAAKDAVTLRTEDIRRLMTEHRNEPMAVLAVIMLLLGLRIGEALGLRWGEIDMTKRSANICRQMVKYRKGGHNVYEIKEYTKNGKADNAIFPEAAIEWFCMQQTIQSGWRILRPDAWTGYEGYVFTDRYGCPLDYDKVYYEFGKLMKNIGRPDMTLQGLRHTAASIAHYASRDRLAVRELMRDRSLGASDGYVHVTIEQEQALADSLHRYFAPIIREVLGEEYCRD